MVKLSKTPAVTLYLVGLAALALEVAERPHLLPTFLRILRLAPRTALELARAERIAA